MTTRLLCKNSTSRLASKTVSAKKARNAPRRHPESLRGLRTNHHRSTTLISPTTNQMQQTHNTQHTNQAPNIAQHQIIIHVKEGRRHFFVFSPANKSTIHQRHGTTGERFFSVCSLRSPILANCINTRWQSANLVILCSSVPFGAQLFGEKNKSANKHRKWLKLKLYVEYSKLCYLATVYMSLITYCTSQDVDSLLLQPSTNNASTNPAHISPRAKNTHFFQHTAGQGMAWKGTARSGRHVILRFLIF